MEVCCMWFPPARPALTANYPGRLETALEGNTVILFLAVILIILEILTLLHGVAVLNVKNPTAVRARGSLLSWGQYDHQKNPDNTHNCVLLDLGSRGNRKHFF